MMRERAETMRRSIRARIGIALVVGVMAASAAQADTTEARKVVDETLAQVLAILNEPDLASPVRVKKIEDIARERFDFELMSRLVLRSGWRRFDARQQQQFVDAFRDHLSASYGSRIDRYEQQSVEVTGEQLEARGDVTVKTRIVGGTVDDLSMDYRLRQRNGVWRVIDVKIEGVSLVSNFHSQFKEVLAEGGPEEVLRRLREKTAAGEATS